MSSRAQSRYHTRCIFQQKKPRDSVIPKSAIPRLRPKGYTRNDMVFPFVLELIMAFREKWSTGWRLIILASGFVLLCVIPYELLTSFFYPHLQVTLAITTLGITLTFEYFFKHQSNHFRWVRITVLFVLTFFLLNGHLIATWNFPILQEIDHLKICSVASAWWHAAQYIPGGIDTLRLALVYSFAFIMLLILLRLLTLPFYLISRKWLKGDSIFHSAEKIIVYMFICFMLSMIIIDL